MHHAYNGVDTSGTDAQLKKYSKMLQFQALKIQYYTLNLELVVKLISLDLKNFKFPYM